MKNPVSGNGKTETTFHYAGPETREGRELQKISLDMKFQFGEGKEAMINVTDQESTGATYFDNELGQFVASESMTTMKMQISAMGQQLEQEMEINTKTECSPQQPSEKKGDGSPRS